MGVVNVFVFKAIWVLLHSEINNRAFGNCVNVSGKNVAPSPHSPPPLPQGQDARTPMIKDKNMKLPPELEDKIGIPARSRNIVFIYIACMKGRAGKE